MFTDPADGKSKMWVLGGSRFVGGAMSYLQDVYKSENGTTWTSAIGTPFTARENGTALVFTDPADGVSKLWMIGGVSSIALTDSVYKSANGTTWVEAAAASDNLPPRFGHAAAVFPDPANSNAPTMWVFGGRDSAGTFTDDVYKSVDGTHWTLATSAAAFGARTDAVVLNYKNKLYLMGGLNSSSVAAADVWQSSDGVSWARVAGMPSLPDAQFGGLAEASGMVYDDKMWVVNSNFVWYSIDGANWTKAADPAAYSTRSGQASLTFNPGGGERMWVIGGHQSSPGNYNSDVWYAS